MQVQYQTMRVYDFSDVSRCIDELLQLKTSSGWDMLDRLFNVDEPRNDSAYVCKRPYRNTLVKYGCSDDLFFNTIVPSLWGDSGKIIVQVSW